MIQKEKKKQSGPRKSKTSNIPMGKHRSSIRMSKLARGAQTATSKSNWSQMAKLLFWGDADQGRHDEIVKLHYYTRRKLVEQDPGVSYNGDQLQYILLLMLVLTTAEKRTQEMYQRHFAQRCDEISKSHGLSEDQYWIDGKIPAEWQTLDADFEKRSVQILVETLREYSLNDIAEEVQESGAMQFLEIIGNIESQFLKVLTSPIAGSLKRTMGERGAIPETLQNSVRS